MSGYGVGKYGEGSFSSEEEQEGYLLAEDGSYLLNEDGSRIRLEEKSESEAE